MRVLLVEDDDRVAVVVERALGGAGHRVTRAPNRAAADAALADAHHDLAVVDVGLPDGSGLELCRAMRDAGLALPILVLTARTGVSDRVAGLDAGADDYLGKPFSVAELLARVRALGRRGPHFAESRRVFGGLTIDRDARRVTQGSAVVALTPREFEVVALLAWRDGRVVSRGDILESVWGDASEGAAASLDVLLTRIRRKLAPPDGGEVIRTVRQVGYAWVPARSKSA